MLADNHTTSVADALKGIVLNATTLDITTGYFHARGFDVISPYLGDISQIRLIMGDETDRDTAAQLKRGHKKTKRRPSSLKKLYHYIRSDILQVRLYPHGRLHAKAYITDHTALIGSSNMSKAGLSQNLELNLTTPDTTELTKWFTRIWEESVPYNNKMLRVRRRSARKRRRR